MKEFRTLTYAQSAFGEIQKAKLPYFAKNQLERAGLSVVLNLTEGAARRSGKERLRFYEIAMGSYRECAIIIKLYKLETLNNSSEILGRHLGALLKAQPVAG